MNENVSDGLNVQKFCLVDPMVQDCHVVNVVYVSVVEAAHVICGLGILQFEV
jgi:hypothetical protein